MSEHDPSSRELARLSSGAASDPALARIGELARDVPKATALSDAALERVFRRLTASPVRSGGFGPRRLAVVLAVLVTPAPKPPEAPVARTLPAPRAAAPSSPSSAVTAAPAVAVRAPSVATAPTATPESQLAAETKALEPAVGALRRERDAGRALTLLGRYEQAFPHGVLALEARVLRIDALLALGRRSEALVELDALPLERVGRGVELRLVRAELRAAGDCRSALPDFDRVMSMGISGGLEERALRGRSLCRASLGDAVGARSDSERYLAKYPAGRFAAELGGARTPSASP